MNTSRETSEYMKEKGLDKLEIVSFFPIDSPYCECKKQIVEVTRLLMKMSPDEQRAYKAKQRVIHCERSKEGLKHFKIVCANCSELQGTLWSKDETLKEWIDFHYYQYTDGKNWHGCQTPNLSVITLQLTLQCFCGQDTRDFRNHPYYPDKGFGEIEEKNAVGREFGNKDSKFFVMINE